MITTIFKIETLYEYEFSSIVKEGTRLRVLENKRCRYLGKNLHIGDVLSIRRIGEDGLLRVSLEGTNTYSYVSGFLKVKILSSNNKSLSNRLKDFIRDTK